MRTKKALITAFILFMLGISAFFYKAYYLGFPLVANEQVQSWYIETKLEFSGRGGPVTAQLYLPRANNNYSLADESFISQGFGLSTIHAQQSGNRQAQWTKRKPNTHEVLFYRAILYETRQISPDIEKPQAPDVPRYNSEAFNALVSTDDNYYLLKSILDDLSAVSADRNSAVSALFQFMRNNADSRVTRLKEQGTGLRNNNDVVVYLLQHLGLPARVMNGVVLASDERNVSVRSWVEIYADGKWSVYNYETDALESPKGYFAWWSGSQPLATVENAGNVKYAVSMKKHTESILTEAIWKGSPLKEALYKVSIFSLPVDAQLVLAVLLSVPLGALVVCFLRQMIGITTFGTFMPVLVALAFRETGLFWGMMLFGIIVTVGLFCRSYLDRLQLLMIPRLSAILTLVVIFMYLLAVVTFNTGIHSGLTITLFPMVILTMLIERVSIAWEEFGPNAAMKSLMGSMITAIISYYVMTSSTGTHLLTTFPELLLCVLALCILIGRYNGFKLMEYSRFKLMATRGR